MCYEISSSSVYTVPATSEITVSGQPKVHCLCHQELCILHCATGVVPQTVCHKGPLPQACAVCATSRSSIHLVVATSLALPSQLEANQQDQAGILCHPILRQLFLGLHVVLRSAKYPINDVQIIKKMP